MCVFGKCDRVGQGYNRGIQSTQQEKNNLYTENAAANMRLGCHGNHLIDIFIFPALILDRCGEMSVLGVCEDEGAPICGSQCS